MLYSTSNNKTLIFGSIAVILIVLFGGWLIYGLIKQIGFSIFMLIFISVMIGFAIGQDLEKRKRK